MDGDLGGGEGEKLGGEEGGKTVITVLKSINQSVNLPCPAQRTHLDLLVGNVLHLCVCLLFTLRFQTWLRCSLHLLHNLPKMSMHFLLSGSTLLWKTVCM